MAQNTSNPRNLALIAILLLVVAFAVCNGGDDDKTTTGDQKKADSLSAVQEDVAYFKAHRDSLLTAFKHMASTGLADIATIRAKDYLPANDSELTAFYRTTRVKVLKAELRKTKSTDFQGNYDRYAELVTLDSTADNVRKRDDYRIKATAWKVLAGDQPEKSALDGSYRAVKRFLKEAANDPGSISISGCTDVYRHENGWLVGCDYRGKNAFGGLVKNSNWFLIQRDQVVEMYDADKYRP